MGHVRDSFRWHSFFPMIFMPWSLLDEETSAYSYFFSASFDVGGKLSNLSHFLKTHQQSIKVEYDFRLHQVKFVKSCRLIVVQSNAHALHHI